MDQVGDQDLAISIGFDKSPRFRRMSYGSMHRYLSRWTRKERWTITKLNSDRWIQNVGVENLASCQPLIRERQG